MREHNIKYRRIIYNENKKRVNIRLLLLIISLIVLFSFAVFFIYNYNQISSQVSGTGKAVLEASNSVYNSIAKIIGLSIEDAEQPEEPAPGEQTQEQQIVEEQLTEQEKEKQEKAAGQKAAGQKVAEEGQEQRKSAEQEKEKQEKTAEQEAKQTTEEEINETSEQAEEAETTESEENITKETNITKEINITIPENITEINITIENATEINVTIPEENITIINETLANITEINETAIAENITALNITALNITALNITTKQYKAVINRRVKWIKTFKNENITETENLILELPKQAENITVKTGEEAREALREIEQYGGVINNTDRNNLITGKVTGYAEIDIRNSKGILTKFINWLKSLTITGNVIQENELQEEITETNENKIINLENIANQTQETEIAIEYYTQAPTSAEENISRGKQVVVSGPDELNYTDILAYSLLDNRISINNSDKIKIYWIKTEITAEEQLGEQETIINETKEPAEITENITLPIIDEPTDNETELINNATVGEEEQATEKEINEEATINVTIINETESEQISEQQTSPITAFAINENELNNNNNFSENLNNLTDIDNEAGEQSNIENITASQITKTTREEINFTAYDLDEDGNIDYVEWNVPHLSNQTYEIIYITKAEHLDENYTFIEDVYEQVKEKDDNYTLIPDGDYLRVTFEKPLDKTKDITIYARAKDNCSVSENNFIMINGTEVPCEIYQKKKRIDEIRRLLGGS